MDAVKPRQIETNMVELYGVDRSKAFAKILDVDRLVLMRASYGPTRAIRELDHLLLVLSDECGKRSRRVVEADGNPRPISGAGRLKFKQ